MSTSSVLASTAPPPTDPSTLASTYGWDTAFAIPVPDVNAAIVSARSTPAGFACTPGGSGPAVTATFGPWQICPGGDGKNLKMTVPMPAVKVGEQSFTDVRATIQIKLELLSHTEVPPPAAGVLKKLVPRTATADPVDDPVVIVDEKIDSTPSMGVIEMATFQVALREWLNANLAEFNHIFAVVNLNEDIDRDAQWAFTTPSYVEYAVLDGDKLADSVFAVLCMTGGRNGDRLTAQVSPNAIPAGTGGGFLVSPTRYLADLLQLSLMHCYPGLCAADVELVSDSSALSLKPGVTVQLPSFDHDGSTYTPTLTDLEISVLGSVMTIVSSTQTEVSPGITTFTTATHWYSILLDNRADGSQTLKFVEVQAADIQHSTRKSTGVEITEIILGVITAIAVVVAGVLTDGAAFVAAAVIIGVLGGLAAAAPSIVALVNDGISPSIDALVLNVTGPIAWPGAKVFTLSFAGLNESLQLGGSPHFGD